MCASMHVYIRNCMSMYFVVYYVSVCVWNLLDELYIFTVTDLESYYVLHRKALLIIQVTSAMTLVLICMHISHHYHSLQAR